MPISKKKKKKEELSASLMGGYLPGTKPTSFYRIDWDSILYGARVMGLSLKLSEEQMLRDERTASEQEAWAREYADHHMTPWEAFYDYTGFPALVSGGVGFSLIYNIIAQPTQVASRTSIFSAARFGFGTAVLLEVTVGTLIFAAAMTVIDPGHKVEGWGLDETALYKKLETDPNTGFWDMYAGRAPSMGTVV